MATWWKAMRTFCPNSRPVSSPAQSARSAATSWWAVTTSSSPTKLARNSVARISATSSMARECPKSSAARSDEVELEEERQDGGEHHQAGPAAHEPGAAPHRLHRGQVLADEHRAGEAEEREGDESGHDREQRSRRPRRRTTGCSRGRAGPTAAGWRPTAARASPVRGATPPMRGRGGRRRRSRPARRCRSPRSTRIASEHVGEPGVAVDLDVEQPEGIDDGEGQQHERGHADDHAGVLAEQPERGAVDGARPRADDVDLGAGHGGAERSEPARRVVRSARWPTTRSRRSTRRRSTPSRWTSSRAGTTPRSIATGDRAAAMTVATATPDGRPSARVVLLRGLRRARPRVLHQLRQPQGRRARRQRRGRRRPVLGRARRADPDRGTGRAGGRRRVGRVLRAAAARPSDRRVGVAPERAGRRPRHARGAGRRGRGAVPGRRAASAALGRVPDRPETVEFWRNRADRVHDRVEYTRRGTRGGSAASVRSEHAGRSRSPAGGAPSGTARRSRRPRSRGRRRAATRAARTSRRSCRTPSTSGARARDHVRADGPQVSSAMPP